MHIQTITLQNMNQWPDMALHLQKRVKPLDGWIVITGDNGTGKSYLLQSIAACLTSAMPPYVHAFSMATQLIEIRHPLAENSSISMQLRSMPGVIPYFPAIFFSQAQLTSIVQWLADLQSQRDVQEKKAQADQHSNLLPQAWRAAHVDSAGLWLRTTKGEFICWTQASAGIRFAISLVLTILRAAFAVLAPRSTLAMVAGVVLIDDIEQHLHAEWQRHIATWLLVHFSKVQFIVSTHSPFICQAAQQIFVLPSAAAASNSAISELTEAEVSHLHKASANAILQSPAFGLYSTLSNQALVARMTSACASMNRKATDSNDQSSFLGSLDSDD